MKCVVVHIDRLVLRGIDPGNAPRVAEGIRAELERRYAAPGAARSLAEATSKHRVRAGLVNAPYGVAGNGFGRQVAGAIDRVIRSGGGRRGRRQ